MWTGHSPSANLCPNHIRWFRTPISPNRESAEAGPSPKRLKSRALVETIKRAFSATTLPIEPDPSSLVVEAVFAEIDSRFGVKQLTPLKLQKLIFFAHGIAAALFDKHLIAEEIEGWPFGPVFKSVYDGLGYKGREPLSFLGDPSKRKPSPMTVLCVGLAVAAHGNDSTNDIKNKSHIPVWHDNHGEVCDHVGMPFDGIKTWFLRDEVIAQEVVPGMLTRVGREVLDEVATLMARDRSMRSGLSTTAITAETARTLDSEVVIWPGQSALNALIVARTRPKSLYNVVGTQLREGSQEYLFSLAELAGLGDWIALARLANLVDYDDVLANAVKRRQQTTTVVEMQRAATSDEEKYAFGAFFFLVDEVSDAISLWRSCSALDIAKVAVAACSDDAAKQLAALGDIAEPYASFAAENLEALRTLGGAADDEALYLFGLLAVRTGRFDDARTALMSVAQRGSDRACESLFNLFPFSQNFTEAELTALAERTQRGRIALASLWADRGDTAKADDLFAKVDTLNRFSALSSGDDALASDAQAVYESLVVIADPEQ